MLSFRLTTAEDLDARSLRGTGKPMFSGAAPKEQSGTWSRK